MNASTTSNHTLGRQLLDRRYLAKDAGGQVVETPGGMYRRVAQAVVEAEKPYRPTDPAIRSLTDIFRRMMAAGEFLPNSPTLMNAGRENGLLSACFVLPVPDDIVGIFDAVKATALVQKAGGGTGFAFDRLRPTSDLVASSGGVTSGPISFMQVFAETTNAIQQGAHRRGANMGLMAIDHPDILKFITAKGEPGKFENFNLSVKITDAFMTTLQQTPQTPHVVTNPRTGRRYLIPRRLDLKGYGLNDLYPLTEGSEDRRNEGTGKFYGLGDLWDLIVTSAHATGEPGVVFIDRINRDNPTPQAGTLQATNPCGEQPLLDYEACNLGSINLARFVTRDGRGLAWQRLARAIGWAIRFLDNVIDVNAYPLPEIKAVTLAHRKIGLGVMGFADALILSGIRYGSDQALAFAARVSAFVQTRAHEASQYLAGIKGSFPHWPGSTWDTRHHREMRNATCTTIAPTGSISLIAGCSSGIEPIYRLVSRRQALDHQEFVEFHPLLEQIGTEEGWLTDSVRQALVEGTPVHQIRGIPARRAEVLVTAHEVPAEAHVRIAAAFQEHTDNAVSKTVNLPAGATVAEVDAVFRLAHRLGGKGITVYRDASRAGQTLSGVQTATASSAVHVGPRPRPDCTEGRTRKFHTGCGTLFVTVNRSTGQGLCEVFANLGKAGGCPSQSEATCRAVSAALRSGVDPKVLVEQLKGIRCLSAIGGRKHGKDIDVLSCPDAIARALADFLDQPPIHPPPPTGEPEAGTCPVCGHRLHRETNCWICRHCGESRCG